MANGYFHFGTESLGYTEFGPVQIVIGDGASTKLISRITGQVAAALNQPTDQLIHQFLFSIKALVDRPQIQIVPMPFPEGSTAEVDRQILAVNAKLIGNAVVALPFDYKFDPPIPAPNGTLQYFLDNRDFVNVEVHFTVQWSDPA